MAKFYMCPSCGSRDTAENWDKSTRGFFECGITGGIVNIEDVDRNSCFYCCPSCKGKVWGENIQEAK